MPLPILTVAQMRAWEQASWAAGISPDAVIARVGREIALRIRRLVPPGGAVLLLAGKGNNGADARAALPHLDGFDVRDLAVTSPAADHAELEWQLARRPALVVDGLFGIGLNRPLSPEWRRFIGILNASELPVLSVDLPSGLDADSGDQQGAVVRATLTLTVGAPKLGLIAAAALKHVGRLEVAADVGLLPDPEAAVHGHFQSPLGEGWSFTHYWNMPSDFGDFPPERALDSHKGTHGHLVIVAGSMGYHGAAVLAARAAGAGRPGLITVLTAPAAYVPVGAQLAAPMVRPWKDPLSLPANVSAFLFGPGLAGTDVPAWLKRELCEAWRALPVPVIADASALPWLREIEPDPDLIRVWTPHPGEAAQLLGRSVEEVQSDRADAAQVLGQAAVTVLKGHQSIVADAQHRCFFNSTGNPGLAQGGTGDVLAGFLAGLLAQPALQDDVPKTVRYAVWEHGAAADRLEALRRNWTAADLAVEIGR